MLSIFVVIYILTMMLKTPLNSYSKSYIGHYLNNSATGAEIVRYVDNWYLTYSRLWNEILVSL